MQPLPVFCRYMKGHLSLSYNKEMLCLYVKKHMVTLFSMINHIPVKRGALDSYDRSTVKSDYYKDWVTTLEERTCFVCRSQNGQIYEMSEIAMPQPPLHPNCRCKILPMEAVVAGNATKDGNNGADWWLKYFGVLPHYYITRDELIKLGWRDGNKLSKFAPNKMYCKGVYDNRDNHLPQVSGRIWYEADIHYTPGRRNRQRILWSK